MQNRFFLVVLRSIFSEKLKIAPPIGRQLPLKRLDFRVGPNNQSQNRWRPFFFFFFGDHLILGEKKLWIWDFGRKFSLKIGEDLFFFLETTWFWAEKTFEFPRFQRNFVSIRESIPWLCEFKPVSLLLYHVLSARWVNFTCENKYLLSLLGHKNSTLFVIWLWLVHASLIVIILLKLVRKS